MNITEIKVRRADKYQKTRVYFFKERETILENLENRRARPYDEFKKAMRAQVLAELKLPSDTKIRWSQKAGCACGCSPAIIIDEHYNNDVFVTYS